MPTSRTGLICRAGLGGIGRGERDSGPADDEGHKDHGKNQEDGEEAERAITILAAGKEDEAVRKSHDGDLGPSGHLYEDPRGATSGTMELERTIHDTDRLIPHIRGAFPAGSEP
uniref:Uncharacterized protein n=1 Tax=Coccidioides posadasii RMSCC 3488 TaxID=454284 RepID=A0A0J6FAQ7_COCPO|nr:hypothetical protein CPAG_02370 [Coccidioides posadasii RMSCC 3488]